MNTHQPMRSNSMDMQPNSEGYRSNSMNTHQPMRSNSMDMQPNSEEEMESLRKRALVMVVMYVAYAATLVLTRCINQIERSITRHRTYERNVIMTRLTLMSDELVVASYEWEENHLVGWYNYSATLVASVILGLVVWKNNSQSFFIY